MVGWWSRSWLPLPECSLLIELHERLRAATERRPPARDRGGLDRLEQLPLGRAVLDGPAHVGDDPFLPAAEGEDPDDHHLAVLDREFLAFPDGQVAQGLPGPEVLGILLRDPVPEGVAIGASGLLRLAGSHRGSRGFCRRTTCAHRCLLLGWQFMSGSLLSYAPSPCPLPATGRGMSFLQILSPTGGRGPQFELRRSLRATRRGLSG